MRARDENPPGGPPVDAGEPRRLLDDPDVDAHVDGAADPSAAWALGLLRGAEPYRAPAGRKQRVQLRLGHAPRRRAPLVLRLATATVMVVVLCSFAAVVSAALGHWPDWMARAYERVVGSPPPAHGPKSASARARVARRASPPVEPAPPAEIAVPVLEGAPEPIAPAPSVVSAPPVEPRRPSREVSAAPRAHRAAAAPAQPASEDAAAVATAMRALRVDQDPVRARGLLSRYLADHPNGALAEEALAMTIEAAIAHHDTDVATLAGRYLRLYPRGSFQALARNALVAQPSAPTNDARAR
jgi:hypothetical protein